MSGRRSVCFSICSLMLGVALVAPLRAEESYRFSYQQPQVGDAALQTVDYDLQLGVTMLQSGQTIDTFQQNVVRKQTRTLTVLKCDERRVLVARIAFDKSQQSTTTDKDEQKKPLAAQPVEGKSYVVSRPDENGELVITYEDGTTPPEEELTIVEQSAAALGRPNALAAYFNGRTVRIGEPLKMPNELASELMGFRKSVDEVTRFEMKLVEVRPIDGKPCGVFETVIDAGQPHTEGMKLRVQGRFVMEIDTCRTRSAEFAGPVAVTQQRGPKGYQFTVAGHGKMHVAIQSSAPPLRR